MKTVIEMAREAGFRVGPSRDGPDDIWGIAANLKDFADLVRADEAEKYKWDIHSCGPTCTKAACVAMREAVEAEREACAKVLEDRATHIENNHRRPHYGFPHELRQSIAAIRARSNT